MNIFEIFCNTSNNCDKDNDDIQKCDKSTNTNTNTILTHNISNNISELKKTNIYYLRYKRRTSIIIKRKSKLSFKRLCCICCCGKKHEE